MEPGTRDRLPVVSVLVPCWNAEASVERAVRSVLEARDVPLECILVDDGSTDRTLEIAHSVAAGDGRVVVISLPHNEGVSNARNRGLEAARGEWLTLLDADDRFLPGGLARLIGEIGPGVEAVVGQQVWTDGQERWLTSLYDIPDIRTPGRTSLAARPGLLYFVSPHAKLFRRASIDGLRFRGRVLGDQPWVIRALLRAGDGIEVLGETVYEWYRPRGQGTSITGTTRSSVRRGLEAVTVAGEALGEVRQEARHELGPAAAEELAGRYVERLLRSDLSIHLRNALDRRDPFTADLLEAILAFILAVPPTELSASDALVRDILEPPLRRWHRLDRPARVAFWRLFGVAARLDDLPPRSRGWLTRLTLRAGRSATGRAIAPWLLTGARTVGRLRLRRAAAGSH
jgi:glycosyltransferase involved in cell wall biosynthesis